MKPNESEPGNRDVGSQAENYEWTLRHGGNTRSRHVSEKEQVERWRKWREEDRELLARTREILNEAGVSRLQYLSYYNFVRQVRCKARIYTSKVLSRATWGIIDQWAFRGLDERLLEFLASRLFDIEPWEAPRGFLSS